MQTEIHYVMYMYMLLSLFLHEKEVYPYLRILAYLNKDEDLDFKLFFSEYKVYRQSLHI